MTHFHDSLFCCMQSGDSIVYFALEFLESLMQTANFLDTRLQLVYESLRKVPVMLIVVHVILDAVQRLSGFTLFLYVVEYTFRFTRQVGKLLTNFDERVVLLLDLI